MKVCVLVNLENAACAGRSDPLSLPDKEQEGTQLACVYVSAVSVCRQSPACVCAPGRAISFATS